MQKGKSSRGLDKVQMNWQVSEERKMKLAHKGTLQLRQERRSAQEKQTWVQERTFPVTEP